MNKLQREIVALNHNHPTNKEVYELVVKYMELAYGCGVESVGRDGDRYDYFADFMEDEIGDSSLKDAERTEIARRQEILDRRDTLRLFIEKLVDREFPGSRIGNITFFGDKIRFSVRERLPEVQTFLDNIGLDSIKAAAGVEGDLE